MTVTIEITEPQAKNLHNFLGIPRNQFSGPTISVITWNFIKTIRSSLGEILASTGKPDGYLIAIDMMIQDAQFLSNSLGIATCDRASTFLPESELEHIKSMYMMVSGKLAQAVIGEQVYMVNHFSPAVK